MTDAIVAPQYRSNGWDVYRRDRIVATCSTGPDGELASSVAARIAALLNGVTPPDPEFPPRRS